MDFQLTFEQKLLQQSVASRLKQIRSLKPVSKADPTDDSDCGSALAELGILGICVPVELGGLGLGLVEAMLAGIETGRIALIYPAIETMACAAAVIEAYPEAAANVLEGRDPISASAAADLRIVDGRLEGEILLPFAKQARWIVAPFGDGGEAAIFARPNAVSRSRSMVEPGVANADVTVSLCRGQFRIMTDHGLGMRLHLLRNAEAYGAAQSCFDAAIQYLKDRVQFGKPLGANQALKHLAADNFLRLENVRVALEYAASAYDGWRALPNDEQRRDDSKSALNVVLAFVPDAARRVVEDAVQMHGGIGVTSEYGLNRPLRRILRLAAASGPVKQHRRRLAQSLFDDIQQSSSSSFQSAVT